MMASSAIMRINGLVGNTEAANKSYCPQSLVLGTNFALSSSLKRRSFPILPG
ncbi:hypothetical protein ACE6H2_002839 [Prunus campanulata]